MVSIDALLPFPVINSEGHLACRMLLLATYFPRVYPYHQVYGVFLIVVAAGQYLNCTTTSITPVTADGP